MNVSQTKTKRVTGKVLRESDGISYSGPVPLLKDYANEPLVDEAFFVPSLHEMAASNPAQELDETVAEKVKGFSPDAKIMLAIKFEKWAAQLRRNAEWCRLMRSAN